MRPTEISEDNVYIVQYKILGRESSMGNQLSCSLTNAAAASTTVSSSSQPHTDDEQRHEDNASASTLLADVQSPPTSGQPMSESSARKLKILKVFMKVQFETFSFFIVVQFVGKSARR